MDPIFVIGTEGLGCETWVWIANEATTSRCLHLVESPGEFWCYAHLNSICQAVFPKLIVFLPCIQAYGATAALRWVPMPGNRCTGSHTSPVSSKYLFALVNSESKVSHHMLLSPMDRFLPPTVKSNNQKLYPHQWLLSPCNCLFFGIIYFTENSLSLHF